jgi:hypothetical protein
MAMVASLRELSSGQIEGYIPIAKRKNVQIYGVIPLANEEAGNSNNEGNMSGRKRARAIAHPAAPPNVTIQSRNVVVAG